MKSSFLFLFALAFASKISFAVLSKCVPGTNPATCVIRDIRLIEEDGQNSAYLSSISNVTILDVTASKIPQWIFEKAKNLNSLSMNSTSLSALGTKETFQNAPNLQQLYLSNNLIESIDEHSFWGAKTLQVLVLSHNRISEIHEDALDSLTELRILNLEGNHIRELPWGTFFYTKSIQVINLNNNLLSTFDEHTFKKCQFLRELYVNHNQLQGNVVLKFAVYNLKRLELNFNRLDKITIDEESCGLQDEIGVIEVQHNALENSGLPSCASLSVNFYNNSLSGAYNPLDHFVELNNGKNPEGNIEHFADLKSLKVLNISEIKMTHVPRDAFNNLKELKVLDMSNNSIGDFDLMALKPLTKLEYLNLNGTGRQNLDPVFLKAILPNLKLIELSENNFDAQTMNRISSELRDRVKMSNNRGRPVDPHPISPTPISPIVPIVPQTNHVPYLDEETKKQVNDIFSLLKTLQNTLSLSEIKILLNNIKNNNDKFSDSLHYMNLTQRQQIDNLRYLLTQDTSKNGTHQLLEQMNEMIEEKFSDSNANFGDFNQKISKIETNIDSLKRDKWTNVILQMLCLALLIVIAFIVIRKTIMKPQRSMSTNQLVQYSNA